ncbi:hypothetical protein NG895_17450 [Aeoliella sp. ICT_H6.2]|uniref:Uncharacterized protein n=1 Tax=Aeoliella straminimaris TaxID=2954799 RepID=A0A9X2JHD3_9BACT|nr:hypothetical protein [Aeoliella straminimaris]MCO6045686.1 hypothetical protein [Aeoliella straminimaris]
MGIQVRCPHGHVFKVKDKYAGKRGLCPHCTEQVIVEVPSADNSDAMVKAYRKAVTDEHRASHAVDSGSSSIFDDIPHDEDPSTSASLLGSSVIRHHVRCEFCNQSVPMWYAKCPACGHFMDQG